MEMTPDQWREVEGLVDRALRLPGEERARFLIDQCGDDTARLEQVLDLLLATSEAEAIATPAWAPSDTAGDSPKASSSASTAEFVKQPAHPGSGAVANVDPAQASGSSEQKIGSFEVLHELGRGGMGTVYLAQQFSPVERQVAVKVAHQPLGSEGRRRLAAERQAMARLSHPNIAQVLEAGSTEEGHPYFAMELVRGVPITSYCDHHELDVGSRLRLFLGVCSGVQHAHQKGILHRDLKPSNVLVAEVDGTPVAKIIDFGIAKALDQPLVDSTLVTGGRIIGTPAYIGPEALTPEGGGAVSDTRGDVYSLGVLLQELLIGQRPFRHKAGETPLAHWRRKTEQDPASLSRRWRELDSEDRELLAGARATDPQGLSRRIRGDLEWIVQRAIAREPVDRYSGVSELAADIERHLADQPVLAGPPTATYQLRKLVQRHRGLVGFTALLLLSLIGGLVARSMEADRANREAAEARAAREETERVVDFLTELFDAASPEQALGEEPTVREVLQVGTERLVANELDETPRVRSRLLVTLGDVHWSLGDPETALELARDALEVRRSELGAEHPEVGDSLQQVATLESEVGNFERSQELLQEALEVLEKAHGRSSLAVISLLKVMGAIDEETSRYEDALAHYQEALDLVDAGGWQDSLHRVDLLNNVGVIYWRLSRYDEAVGFYQQSLAAKEQMLEPDHPSVAMTLNNLGDTYRDMERFAEAQEAYRRSLTIREKVLGPEHPHLGVTLNSMGNLARALGQWQEAEELLQRTRAIWEQALGPDHAWVAYPFGNLGGVYYDQGRDEEAEAVLRRALEIERAAYGESNRNVGSTLAQLGKVLRMLGRPGEASQALQAAEEMLEASSGSTWWLTTTRIELGFLALDDQRLAEAEQIFRAILEEADELGDRDSRAGNALRGLAGLELARGRPEQAAELARQAVAALEVDLPKGQREVVAARALLASD
ncbi:MAG: serine/threonine-protein kinase [Acidobacteriota bacterium]